LATGVVPKQATKAIAKPGPSSRLLSGQSMCIPSG
jgi:hypothetical protein